MRSPSAFSSFSLLTYDFKTNTINAELYDYTDYLSRRMIHPTGIHCCKRPNYNF